jgi:glycosyltransferase involved in cell wall biosynthesis
MSGLRVAYLCRFVPAWRLPQLRSLVKSDAGIHLIVLAVKIHSAHKHSGVQYLREPGLSVEVLPSISTTLESSGRTTSWFFSPSLALRLVQQRPDVILMEGGSNLPNNLIGFIYGIATATPIVWWSLGSIPGRKYGLLGKVFRLAVACLERQCDALVGYSSRAVRYFRSIGISELKCFRAVNVIDVDSIMAGIKDVLAYRRQSRNDLGLKSDEPVLIFVGSVNPAKKAHLLPVILRKVRSTYGRATMTIIGDGPSLGTVREVAEEQGMTPYIRFLGAMSEGVGRHFAAADVMLLPGLGGLAIGESLAYGTPVVCSIADGTEEDLIDNPFSGIVLVGDQNEDVMVDQFTQAIVAQLKHGMQNPQSPLIARSQVESRYTLRNYALAVRDAIYHAHQNK